jgi:hypothetical protein
MVDAIAAALHRALVERTLRFGIDGLENDFQKPRAIVQFRTDTVLYDWFFNARTGYRAQFWIGTARGLAFNAALVEELSGCLMEKLPTTVPARRIVVEATDEERIEHDAGPTTVDREFLLTSLLPSESKVWMCERLIQVDGKDPEQIGTVVLVGSRDANLHVPRWAKARDLKSGVVGEGQRAPFPDSQYAWLDLKGGFVVGNKTEQYKGQEKRAIMIHERGWT